MLKAFQKREIARKKKKKKKRGRKEERKEGEEGGRESILFLQHVKIIKIVTFPPEMNPREFKNGLRVTKGPCLP